MSSGTDIRLATVDDALSIARMSRDLIERGLGWSWTPLRVRRSIVDAATNVALAIRVDLPVGFGIMSTATTAHLLLLAVNPTHARQGIGTQLVGWLEAAARVAGIAGLSRSALREFDRAGVLPTPRYAEIQTVRGYYGGVESSVRMAKDLWLEQPASA